MYRSGVRVLEDSYRPLFKLAIQQSEGLHGIRAMNPILFYWDKRPAKRIDGWKHTAYRNYLMGVFAYLGIQFALVFAASFLFSKIGFYN